jgi:hypothetical protein
VELPAKVGVRRHPRASAELLFRDHLDVLGRACWNQIGRLVASPLPDDEQRRAPAHRVSHFAAEAQHEVLRVAAPERRQLAGEDDDVAGERLSG